MAVAWTRGRPGSVLDIELISPYGQGFETGPENHHFLRRASIPDGQESSHIDLDGELNDLLRQAS